MSIRTSILALAAVATVAAAALATTTASAKPIMGVIIKPPVLGVVPVKPPVFGVIIHPPHPNWLGQELQAIDLLTAQHDDSIVGVLQDVMQKEDDGYIRTRARDPGPSPEVLAA